MAIDTRKRSRGNRGDWFLRFLLADPMDNLRFE